MASDTDATGNPISEDKDLGEGAEDLRDHPDDADPVADNADPHTDRQLDKGLKETFPASDPVSINPGAD